jgi:glycosyltransferase involved in cell wall biosynthesis
LLSVVVRTRGTRRTLADTLTCLAAQTSDDFEVLLFVDTEDDADEQAARVQLEPYDDGFRSRVHVRRLRSNNRVTPLNAAIDVAAGRWFAVLDDDDLVTADWVERFRDGATDEGTIVRSRGVEQHVRRSSGVSDVEPTSGFQLPYAATFDLLDHMLVNQSPIHTLAFPTRAFRTLGIRFDPELPVYEDLDVILRAAQWCGVHDTGAITAIYRRWDDAEASIHAYTAEQWAATKTKVLERLDARPLLLPPGNATRLVTLLADVERLRSADVALEAMERSRVWRATRPVRVALADRRVRRVFGRARRLVGAVARRLRGRTPDAP